MRVAGLAGVLAAGLATCAPACAKDPNARPSALLADGLRACPDGGFALPGSPTCIRLGGTVEASTVIGTSRAPASRGFFVRNAAQARMSIDARTPTELGPLRVYMSVRGGAPDLLRR